MAKYRIIPSSRTIVQSPISIGHKAEKGVEAIEFDVTAWVETYGSGTLTVIMRRWEDAIPYPIALEIDENNKATWVLSDTDTARAGMAYAQLSYIVGETVVKKSDIYTFRVMDSLTGEGDPPEAYESWLEHLTHIAAEAMAEVLDIESIVTDKTLTVDGGIADAKATGEALAEKVDAADYRELSDRVGANTIALAEKADRSTTYTKTEVDALIDEVEVETDTTLEIAGAPADAKTVGDELTEIKADLDDTNKSLQSKTKFLAFEQGNIISASGIATDSTKYIRTKTKIDHAMHIDTGSDDFVVASVCVYNTTDDSFVSSSAIGTRLVDINPATGTYVKLTVRRSNTTDINPSDIQPDGFVNRMTDAAQDTDSNSLALTATEDYTDLFVKGAYIANSMSVGQPVSLSPITNASYAYIAVPCRVGDVFTLTGTGGGAQRLYCFITDKYKQVEVTAQNASLSADDLIAPVNGYFIANVQAASTYNLSVTHRVTIDGINDIVRRVGETTIDYTPLFIKGKTIVDNGSVGDTVTITPTINDAYGHIVVKCAKGDKFTLTGNGGSTALIWCFVDKDYKILSRATTTAVNNLELIAQQDGYLISNVQQWRNFSLIKTGCNDPSVLQDIFNTMSARFIMPSSIYGKSGVSMYAYTPEIFSNWKHLNNYQLTLSGLTDAQSIEDSVAPRMILPLATKTMKMSLQNYRNNEVVNKSVSVKTVSTLSKTSATVLVIGDSFIHYKWGDGILKYMSDFATDDGVSLTFIGTVTTGYGYQAEGRGGWSALDYLTHYVPVSERDPSATNEQKKMPSPFVFSDNDTVADAYFDFAQYLTANNLSAPDAIIISLGMNDGNTSADAINTMIADIHGDYPNIPIIVSMIPTVPRRITTGDFYSRKTTRENQNLSYITKFDGREPEKIYISPEHLALDGILGLIGDTRNVNPVSLESGDEVTEIVNTSIHPTAVGAWNIAKWKYETLLYVMQQ